MYDTLISLFPASHPWREKIHYFDTIASTNTAAKKMAAAGAPEGTVLIADLQTGGRGRMGRSFHSPAGCGIYMSVILRPACPAKQLMHLTCAVAVATSDAIEQVTGLRPGIKWTNDLVFGRRKLGGILTELSLDRNGCVDYAVLGVGINCCQTVGDFPEELRDIATSLQLCTGKPVDRAAIAGAMIETFERMNQTLTDPRLFMTRYRTDCITIGQQISLLRGDEVRHGTALNVDEGGALMVKFDDGHIEAVNSGEVSVRGMYGYI